MSERPNIVEQLIDPETGRPKAQGETPATAHVREGLDADSDEVDVEDDGALDIASDESFPASDPSAPSQPGRGNGPMPGGKYD
jgi:hypothetical protein